MEQNLKQENKIRVWDSKLEEVSYSEGGYMKYKYNGKPFNGYMIVDKHPNGNIMYEEEYKEGEHLGWDNEYYESGELKESSLYVGATCLVYYEYDKQGNVIGGGNKQVSEEAYAELVEQYKLLE